MSNLFPKYKKRYTLQTALLVKNNSFSFHFPLVSPTAQPLPQAEPLGGNPLTRDQANALGLCAKGSQGVRVGPGETTAI